MTPDTIIDLSQQALYLIAMIAAPMLLSALGIGLVHWYVPGRNLHQRTNPEFYPQTYGSAVVDSGGRTLDA